MTKAEDGYGYIMSLFTAVSALPFTDEQLMFPHELARWAPRLNNPGAYRELKKSLVGDARELRIEAMTPDGKVALVPMRGKNPYQAWDMGQFVEGMERVFFAGVDAHRVARFVAITSEEEIALLWPVESVAHVDLRWLSLRSEAAQLAPADCCSAARALALLRWQERTQYCPRCAGKLVSENGGESQRCANCDHVEYPRQDPAVIVLITDEAERVLLAHNRSWKPRFMSLIAGFVEAGESPERAVVREVKEEADLDVEDVHYWAAQPWPFPCSLMMGFTARVKGSPTPHPDLDEVDRMRWVTREELMAYVEAGELEIPTHTAIARHMIDHWLDRQERTW